MPGIHVTHLAISKLQGIDDQRNGSRRLLSVVGEPNASAWVCVSFFNLPSAGHVWTRWWRHFPTSSLRRSRLKLSFRTSTHRLTGIFRSGLCHYGQVSSLPLTPSIPPSLTGWQLLAPAVKTRFLEVSRLHAIVIVMLWFVKSLSVFARLSSSFPSLSLFLSPSLSHLIVGFA